MAIPHTVNKCEHLRPTPTAPTRKSWCLTCRTLSTWSPLGPAYSRWRRSIGTNTPLLSFTYSANTNNGTGYVELLFPSFKMSPPVRPGLCCTDWRGWWGSGGGDGAGADCTLGIGLGVVRRCGIPLVMIGTVVIYQGVVLVVEAHKYQIQRIAGAIRRLFRFERCAIIVTLSSHNFFQRLFFSLSVLAVATAR